MSHPTVTEPIPAANPRIEALLWQLVMEIRGLRADLARERKTVTPLSRSDRDQLARMLPAIAGALGSEPFNSAEICEHETPALQLVRAGLSARQLGRLLRRAEGIAIAGYMVERLGSEAGSVLWRVVQVPEFSGNEKVFIPHVAARGRV